MPGGHSLPPGLGGKARPGQLPGVLILTGTSWVPEAPEPSTASQELGQFLAQGSVECPCLNCHPAVSFLKALAFC